jgi:hypothetical protein
MGWVTMSKRDLQRIEVLTEVLAGRRTIPQQQCWKLVRNIHAGC